VRYVPESSLLSKAFGKLPNPENRLVFYNPVLHIVEKLYKDATVDGVQSASARFSLHHRQI
jgi:hypothetical protein